MMTVCVVQKQINVLGLDTPLYCSHPIPYVSKLFLNGPQLTPKRARFVDTIRTSFLSGMLLSQRQGHADFHIRCNAACFCCKLYSFSKPLLHMNHD